MQIDPSRISQALQLLAKPAGAKLETATTKTSPTSAKPSTKTVEQLRTRLKVRLGKIRDSAKFDEQAPMITVQEILLWEFGDNILENPNFEQVVQKVTSSMTTDERLSRALHKITNELKK